MDRTEKIQKVQALVNGEQPEYIEVVHDGETIGKIENDVSLTVEADTKEAGETLLKLRNTKIV